MPTYKEMYLTLARAQRDAVSILQEAHQKAEEILLSVEVSDHLHVLRPESLQREEEANIHRLNLSARTYNALKRRFREERGHNHVPTINDVLSLESYQDLQAIRNLGEKSYLELIAKMQEAGFTDWAEQMLSQLDRYLKNRK